MVSATGSAGGPGPAPTSTPPADLHIVLSDDAPAPERRSLHVDDAVLASIVRASVNPYAVLDEQGTVHFVSEPIEQLLGRPAVEHVGRNVMEFIAPEHQAAVATAIEEFVDPHRPDEGWTGPPISVDLVHADGHRVPCRVLGVGSGREGFGGVVVRIRQTATTAKLDRAMEGMITSDDLDEVLGLLIDVLGEQMPGSSGVVGVGWDGSRFASMVAAADAPSLPNRTLPVDHADLPWIESLTRGEPRSAGLAEMPTPLSAAAAAAGYSCCWTFPIELAGSCENVLVVWRRILGTPTQHLREATERIVRMLQLAFTAHHSRRALEHQARTDPLTGVANRLALFDRLDQIGHDPHHGPVGFLYCDLDDFKPINDRFGHATGDRVLTIAAHRISSQVRSSDLVARLGGDEFAVLCVGADTGRLAGLARRLVRSFDEPIVVDGHPVDVGISVGSALLDPSSHDGTASSVMQEADHALLAAKAGGKGMWRPAR